MTHLTTAIPVVRAWDQLQAFLAADPDRLGFPTDPPEPKVSEALTLIKYATPDPLNPGNLPAALDLLLEATIEIAREHYFFEVALVTVVELLREHLEGGCGLMHRDGKWVPDPSCRKGGAN
jgi:hypothetical protein